MTLWKQIRRIGIERGSFYYCWLSSTAVFISPVAYHLIQKYYKCSVSTEYVLCSQKSEQTENLQWCIAAGPQVHYLTYSILCYWNAFFPNGTQFGKLYIYWYYACTWIPFLVHSARFRHLKCTDKECSLSRRSAEISCVFHSWDFNLCFAEIWSLFL